MSWPLRRGTAPLLLAATLAGGTYLGSGAAISEAAVHTSQRGGGQALSALLDNVTAQLVSTPELPGCAAPAEPHIRVPESACRRPTRRDPVVVVASGQELAFVSLRADAPGRPQLTRLWSAHGTTHLSHYPAAAGVTATDAGFGGRGDFAAVAASERSVPGPQVAIRYFDSSGLELAPAGGELTPEQRSRIRLVRLGAPAGVERAAPVGTGGQP